jgi:hypothetical protein
VLYDLPVIDMNKTLQELLLAEAQFPVSRVSFKQARVPIAPPREFASSHYDIGPAAIRLVNALREATKPNSEGALTVIDCALLSFFTAAGVQLDDSWKPNETNPASSESASRSLHEEGAESKSFSGTRPDFSFSWCRVPLMEGQDKPKLIEAAEGRRDPVVQLQLQHWLPHHSAMSWRLGMVKQGRQLSFYKLEKRCLKEVQWEMVIQEGAPHCSLACSDQSSADPVIVELGTDDSLFFCKKNYTRRSPSNVNLKWKCH